MLDVDMWTEGGPSLGTALASPEASDSIFTPFRNNQYRLDTALGQNRKNMDLKGLLKPFLRTSRSHSCEVVERKASAVSLKRDSRTYYCAFSAKQFHLTLSLIWLIVTSGFASTPRSKPRNF
jgi:hypothetical protein